MKRLFLIAFFTLLPSCNGIFQGIYDSGEEDLITDYGFLEYNPSDNSGTVYIDATDYTKWVYLDFHGRTAVTAGMSDVEVPSDWDIAVHRYDVKTNGAAALETGMTGLELFISSGKMPEGDYVEDEWTTEQIIVDATYATARAGTIPSCPNGSRSTPAPCRPSTPCRRRSTP